MLFLGAERLLEHGDVPLIILVLLLQRFHLGRHSQQLLVPSLYFCPELVQLRKDSSSRRGSVPVLRPSWRRRRRRQQTVYRRRATEALKNCLPALRHASEYDDDGNNFIRTQWHFASNTFPCKFIAMDAFKFEMEQSMTEIFKKD